MDYKKYEENCEKVKNKEYIRIFQTDYPKASFLVNR